MKRTGVARITRAMERGGYVADPRENVLSILTDLRHYSDQHGLDLGALDGEAHESYLQERHTERIYNSVGTRKRRKS